MTPDAIDLIKQLAAKFGITIEYLWPLLVAYTRWLNVANLALDACWVIAAVFLLTRNVMSFTTHMSLYHNRDSNDYVDYNYHCIWMVVHGFTVLGSAIIILASITSIPGHFVGAVVPEAKAIYDLLAQITAKK